MATKTEDRPAPSDDLSKGRNPGDEYYNRQFSELTGKHYEHSADHPLREKEASAEDSGSAPPDDKAMPPSEVAKAEKSPKNKGFYKPEGGGPGLKLKFRKRRLVIYGGIGGGGLIGIIISLFMFIGPFKLPAIFGNFEHDLPSKRIIKMMVEKPFKRMTMNYLIAKKAGKLGEIARPNSALDRLHKMFDAIDLEKLVKDKAGIELVDKNGKIHILNKGKEVGTVRSDTDSLKSGTAAKDWVALERNNRAFRKASADIYTKAFPIFRVGTVSGRMLAWMKVVGALRTAAPPHEDKSKTPAQNIKEQVTDKALDHTTGETVEQLDNIIGCASGDDGKCDSLKRQKQALEVSDPNLRAGFKTPTGDTSANATQVKQDTKAAIESVKAEASTNLTEALSKTVMKTGVKIVDVIGWIDLLAGLQYLADLEEEEHVIMGTIVALREYQAMTIAAQWWSYSDNIKDGKLKQPFISNLSGRLTGYGTAAMFKAMYNKDTSKAVPVETKIGSGTDDMQKDFYLNVFKFSDGTADFLTDLQDFGDIAACRTLDQFRVINTGPCLMHGFLWLWYRTFGQLSDAITGFLANVFLKTLPQYWLFKLLGGDWETKLVTYAVQGIVRLFGFFGFDPTAIGAPLANSIGVGLDVINNRYMETNLGAREVTNDPNAANAYLEAESLYRDSLASLSLRERLLSSDVPTSLFNQMAAAMPSTLDPQTLIGGVINPIKSLPANLMAAINGRAWAATSAQRMYEVGGVAQYGGTLQEIDAGVPSQITDQQVTELKNVKCPENADGFFNNCQRYKEVIQGAMCYDIKNPCPEWAN